MSQRFFSKSLLFRSTMDKTYLLNVNILKKKTIKSIALAVLVTSLVLVLYQLLFLKMIEEYNRRTILERDNLKVQSLLKPSQSEKEQFVCTPSGISLSIDKLNDDYCDCPDGSDEPMTDACPNGSFVCVQTKVKIPSSRVNDGICDCCDGSDEWKQVPFPVHLSIEDQKKAGVFHPPCPNTCPV